MNEAHARLLALEDSSLSAMPAMLGREAGDILAAALQPLGGSVASARPTQVTWRPGRSLSVVYEARVGWQDGRKGSSERVVAVTGRELPAPATVVGRDDARVAVWRMAADPLLPGLAPMLDPARARTLLDSIDAPEGVVYPQLRSYRPGRRAVVELNLKTLRTYAKIVRPDEVPSLQARHQLMSEHLPVPVSHGWSQEAGLVVLQGLPGATLRDCFADRRATLADPAQLAALLDRIPDPGDGRRAMSVVSMALGHADLLRRIMPELGSRLDAIVAAVSRVEPAREVVPVHGDFHEAQLLVSGGAVSGLLDLDTVALGERADDWATLLGHLATWEESVPPSARAHVRNFARSVVAIADEQSGDPAALRLRVAAIVLGMATGPFRVQSPDWPQGTRRRVTLAERWIESARAIAVKSGPAHKRSLTPLSASSHSEPA